METNKKLENDIEVENDHILDEVSFTIVKDICPICFEDVIPPLTTLECCHTLHDECFKDYITYQLKQNKKQILCPLCRDVILEVSPIVINNDVNSMIVNVVEEQQIQQTQQLSRLANFQESFFEYSRTRGFRILCHTLINFLVIMIVLMCIYIANNCGYNNIGTITCD
jgi:hypothetical protein